MTEESLEPSVLSTPPAHPDMRWYVVHAYSGFEKSVQRALLDRFAGAVDAAHAVHGAHAALEGARSAVAALVRRRDDAARRADYLRHVADEVEAARLREGEEAALNDEATRLTHAEELQTIAGGVAGALEEGDEGVVRRLGQLQRQLAVGHVFRLVVDQPEGAVAQQVDAIDLRAQPHVTHRVILPLERKHIVELVLHEPLANLDAAEARLAELARTIDALAARVRELTNDVERSLDSQDGGSNP